MIGAAVHPRDLRENADGLTTRELPVGAIYRNSAAPDLEFDPPLAILETLPNGGIVVQEVDTLTGEPTDLPQTLDPIPGGGGWPDYAPPLIALPGEGSLDDLETTVRSPVGALSWRDRAGNALYKSRWQALVSTVAGIGVAGIAALAHGEADYSPFTSLGDYVAFALGVSSILALVASITFGFLLYHLQGVTAEKHMLYESFKRGVADLRAYLDEKYEAGIIDRSYDFPFGVIQEITLKDFPVHDFSDLISPAMDAIVEDQRDALEAQDEFGPILRGIAYRVNDIEEAVSGLFLVFVKEVSTIRMLSPVIKAFQTLAVVILTILIALAYYGGVLEPVLFAAALGLTTMAMLLVLELAMVARREARELHGMSLVTGD
jgi:hypothetical protein